MVGQGFRWNCWFWGFALVLVSVVWFSDLVLISAYFELVFANFAFVWFWVLMLVLVLVFMMVVWFCVGGVCMILIWVFSGLGCGGFWFEVVACFCFLIVRV